MCWNHLPQSIVSAPIVLLCFSLSLFYLEASISSREWLSASLSDTIHGLLTFGASLPSHLRSEFYVAPWKGQMPE